MNTEKKLKNRLVIVVFLALVLNIFATYPAFLHTSTSTNVYVDPQNNTFYASTTSVGDHFIISIKVANVTDLYCWQVKLYFDPTLIQAVKAWIPYTDPEYVFYGRTTQMPTPIIDNVTGYVLIADCIITGPSFSGSGLLAKIEFEIMIVPPKGGELSCTLDINNVETFLLDSAMYEIPTTKTNGIYRYVWAPPPSPYLAVDPTLVEYGPYPPSAIGQAFNIKIYIKGLSAAWWLVSASLCLCYNTTVIDVIGGVANVTLNAAVWNLTTSTVAVTHPAEPDRVDIFVMPRKDVTPSGDVLVATIKFTVMLQEKTPPQPVGSYIYSDLTFCDVYLENHIMPIPTGPPKPGKVKIYALMLCFHDIVITNITPSKTVVGQGYSLIAHITIVNRGSFTENFKLFSTCGFIRNLTNVAPGTEIIVDNPINTSKLRKGNYRLFALIPPCFDDCNPCDNIRIEGNFTVAMVGDLTGPAGYPDGKCDMRDVYLVAKGFGAVHITDPNDPRFCQYWHKTPCGSCPHTPNADINNDGKIDMRDIYVVARNFGKKDP